MDARLLNRATLERQLLLEREKLDVSEAVRRVVGLQAQEPVSPYLALWNRIEGFDPADLESAFEERHIVKAPLLRITLHAVAREDYPTFHQAMLSTLRAARLNDRRFRASGLSIEEADALVPGLVEFARQPRTAEEIQRELDRLHGNPLHERVWWALKTYAPLTRAPTGGPWSFGRDLVFEAAPDDPRPERLAAIRALFTRYLAGFGPASVEDFAHFVLHRRATVREALEEGDDDEFVIREGPDGRPLYDLAEASLPDPETPSPVRLLGMWDNVLLAYVDRSRVIPDEYRPLVTRRNGDVLPALLVDGHVAGVWRPVEEGIEVTAFHSLDRDVWDQIEAEAQSVAAWLRERQEGVYRRYHRWWDQLPDDDVRVLSY